MPSLAKQLMKLNYKDFIRKVGKGAILFFIIIILTILMKVFLFASFKVPTPSMEPVIMSGDHILVNKLILGPRIYENIGFLRGKNTKMKRIRGLRKIKRNDVLVFDFPYKTPDKITQGGNLFYVKRCVAIPGDTLYIENGMYKVKGVQEALGCASRQKELAAMDELSFRDDLRNVFPQDSTFFHWTIKGFGPLYVPAKGDKIKIDGTSILLYKNLIEYESGTIVSIKNGMIYLGDSILKNYQFQQDYYFMAGDLVHDSQDSRYWGLLPEDLIIGKATIVWKSEDMNTGKYRWSRFLKIIK